MQFGISADYCGISLPYKSHIHYGSMQNPAIGYVPISLTSICSLPCIPSADATLNKFLLPKEAFAVAAFGNGFYFTEKLYLVLQIYSLS